MDDGDKCHAAWSVMFQQTKSYMHWFHQICTTMIWTSSWRPKGQTQSVLTGSWIYLFIGVYFFHNLGPLVPAGIIITKHFCGVGRCTIHSFMIHWMFEYRNHLSHETFAHCVKWKLKTKCRRAQKQHQMLKLRTFFKSTLCPWVLLVVLPLYTITVDFKSINKVF